MKLIESVSGYCVQRYRDTYAYKTNPYTNTDYPPLKPEQLEMKLQFRFTSRTNQ